MASLAARADSIRQHFERADVRCNVGNSTIIVEYESDGIATHNLVKYWPFLREGSQAAPRLRFCFATSRDWVTYGSYRDLWDWLALQIMAIQPSRFDSPTGSSIIGMLTS